MISRLVQLGGAIPKRFIGLRELPNTSRVEPLVGKSQGGSNGRQAKNPVKQDIHVRIRAASKLIPYNRESGYFASLGVLNQSTQRSLRTSLMVSYSQALLVAFRSGFAGSVAGLRRSVV